MRCVKQQWSLSEIRQLQKLTAQQSNNKGIDWAFVSQEIQTRTQSQCKSYYQNVLKPTLNMSIRKNHMWTKIELFSLWTYAVNFNQDFSFIKTLTNMFDQFTPKQLYSQWNQLVIKQKYIHEKCEQIMNDNKNITEINDKDLKTIQFLLKCANKRWKLIRQKFFEHSSEELEENGHTVDITEIKAIEMFFCNVDIKLLLEVFTEEINDRELQYTMW
ncbi:SANT/Myb_domain [Hexamita inflata]|uniref:SANT/Myb domain n=1 Tax=Hexamita inflata TaxID=28002 RepID=A0AA86PCW6_9EUKA|nr:SANT/Myb domain [Hexamita inflata]